MARMIAADPQAASALRGLRQFLVGGEALPAALVRQLRGLTGARIDNMYGPTETTIWSTTGAARDDSPICSIGRPLANTVLRVLGPDGALVPVGEAGELCIGGAGVTRGYWQRPDLTAERFIDDPFQSGARLYRTGDLVRWSAEGTMDFLGRMDGQIKLRGYRIEIGEIEARLEAIDGVEQAVVTLHEGDDGDRRLIAHVIGADAPDETTLRARLAREMPDYMLPAHVMRLERFPLTPNGKLDRNALPAFRPAAPPRETVSAAPAVRAAAPGTNAAGDPEALAAIWREVLGVAEVAPGDNFFDLGGHSLLAVQMHRLVRAAFGVERLGITDVFRFPVLSALARRIADLGGTNTSDAPPQAAPSAARERADSRNDAIARRREMRAARARKAS